MGHLERGEKNLSFSSMTRVAGALHVTLSDLFLGLESGDDAPRRRRGPGAKAGDRAAPFDRGRLLKRVLNLERAVLTLKDMALASEQAAARAQEPTSVRSRRNKSS